MGSLCKKLSDYEAMADVVTVALISCGTRTGSSMTPDSLQGPRNFCPARLGNLEQREKNRVLS